jgi:alkylhydroperoxidase family enzyme
MERLAPLEPPYASPVADTLAAMMPPGVEPLRLFRMLGHNPRILEKIRAGNLLDRGSIERAVRELVILRTCARCSSEYEWGIHVVVFARRYGLDEAKITGTLEWSADDVRWSATERVLVGMVDELHDTSTLSDALWRALQAHFDAAQIVELIVLAGFYHVISFVTNGFQIDLEPTAERFSNMRSPDSQLRSEPSPGSRTNASA